MMPSWSNGWSTSTSARGCTAACPCGSFWKRPRRTRLWHGQWTCPCESSSSQASRYVSATCTTPTTVRSRWTTAPCAPTSRYRWRRTRAASTTARQRSANAGARLWRSDRTRIWNASPMSHFLINHLGCRELSWESWDMRASVKPPYLNTVRCTRLICNDETGVILRKCCRDCLGNGSCSLLSLSHFSLCLFQLSALSALRCKIGAILRRNGYFTYQICLRQTDAHKSYLPNNIKNHP